MSVKKRYLVKSIARLVGRQLDAAITMGVASAYPLVFNMPTPDPVPDWKRVVKLGWRMVKTTSGETYRILIEASKDTDKDKDKNKGEK